MPTDWPEARAIIERWLDREKHSLPGHPLEGPIALALSRIDALEAALQGMVDDWIPHGGAYLTTARKLLADRLPASPAGAETGDDIVKGLADCSIGAPYEDGSAGEKAAMAAYAVLRCCLLIGAGDWRVPERIGHCTEEMVARPLGKPAATPPAPAIPADVEGLVEEANTAAGHARDMENYLSGALLERPNHAATKLLGNLADVIDRLAEVLAQRMGPSLEEVARVIDPKAWEVADQQVENAVFWERRGDPGARAPSDRLRGEIAAAPSLAKARAIQALYGESDNG